MEVSLGFEVEVGANSRLKDVRLRAADLPSLLQQIKSILRELSVCLSNGLVELLYKGFKIIKIG